jgi:hypothetical protein
MLTALFPLYLSYRNLTTKENVYIKFAIFGLTISQDEFTDEITNLSPLVKEIIKWVCIFTAILLIIVIFTLVMFFNIAKWALNPITLLNKKVKMLLKSDTDLDLESAKKNITSKEALDVYESISELMTTRRFANNHFIQLEDSIAIMEFADAYTVLNDNERAKGICLTNIAHINFKNKNYEKAAASYKNAAQ